MMEEDVEGWLTEPNVRGAEPLRAAFPLAHASVRALDVVDEWALVARARAAHLRSGDGASGPAWEHLAAAESILGEVRPCIEEGAADYILALTTGGDARGVRDVQAIAVVTKRVFMTAASLQGLASCDFVATPTADRPEGVAARLLWKTVEWAESNGFKIALEPSTDAIAQYQQDLFNEDDEAIANGTFEMVTLEFTLESSARWIHPAFEDGTHAS